MSIASRRWPAFEMIAFSLFCGCLWQGALLIERWSEGQLAARDDALSETDRLAASLRRIEAQRIMLSGDEAARSLHETASPSTGAARVQALLDKRARGADVSLDSVQSLGTREVAGVPAAAFRLEGEASYDRWMALIADLENHDPPLVIEAAMLRRVPTGTWSAQPMVYAQLHLFAPLSSPAEKTGLELTE